MSELSKFTDADTAYRLGVMTADPFPPIPVDVTFIHARAHGDNEGIIEHAALLYKLNIAPKIAIIGNEGQKANDDELQGANPGMTYYRNELENLGVTPSDIQPIKDLPAERHTRGESLGLLRLAQEQNWTRAVFPTQPHQSWRAIAGTVSGMRQLDHRIIAFYIRPLYTSWNAIVRGSQGQDEKPRIQHFENEGDRIAFYSNKITPENQTPNQQLDFPDKQYLQQIPDIATPEEVLDYLVWREQAVNKIFSLKEPQLRGSDWIYQRLFQSLSN